MGKSQKTDGPSKLGLVHGSAGSIVVPFISGISRIRFDVAGHDIDGIRRATLVLLDMIEKSPVAPGWAYGGLECNGVANPVTYRKAQHDETGRMLDWPSEDPLPRGYSFVQNAEARNAATKTNQAPTPNE